MRHFRQNEKYTFSGDETGTYRKKTRVMMARIDEPFKCDSREGTLEGKPGDYIAEDGHGGYYPISAEYHAANYVGVSEYKPRAEPPLLMSPENPNGWTLESIAGQLAIELHGKCQKIALDPAPVAHFVHNNNLNILHMLAQIVEIQKRSMDALAEIAPNEGPLGEPRIGNPVQPTGD